jgi:hypothetical protein
MLKASAVLKGAGKDSLTLVAGLATNGATPLTAPDLAIAFGPSLLVNFTSAELTPKGDTFVFKGNRSGVTSVVLDYKRETLTVKGKAMSLGTFADGAVPLTVQLTLGADERADSVRAVHKGTKLKY